MSLSLCSVLHVTKLFNVLEMCMYILQMSIMSSWSLKELLLVMKKVITAIKYWQWYWNFYFCVNLSFVYFVLRKSKRVRFLYRFYKMRYNIEKKPLSSFALNCGDKQLLDGSVLRYFICYWNRKEEKGTIKKLRFKVFSVTIISLINLI